uniref:SH3-containing GRB2-like protein 3-interacting protein 1 n=1 Tax=Takifugu rubripes TaxID=31033 RepID=A0A674PJU9_TAKRU
MEGLKKRTRKAFGIRKKEKDNDSTGSPDRDGGPQKKSNGAPNGFYGEIDWDRYNSPEVDDEGYSIRPDDDPEGDILTTLPSLSHEEEDHRKKFKIKIKPLLADRVVTAPTVDELKASIGNISLSPSPVVKGSNRKPSIADLDNIFGPEDAPPAGEDRDDAWVCFSEESADRLQTQESAALPPLPTSPPPPESPAPPLPTSPLSAEQPGPPLPTSPPPKEEALPPLPSSPPPSEEPAAPPVPTGPHTPEDQNPPTLSTPPASTPPKESVTPPTSSPPSIESPTTAPAPPAPKARTPPALTPPANGPGTDPLPPPPVSQEGQSKVTEPNPPKDGGGENVTSPSDSKQSSRSAHPPPPPPTYRATVSSPTPGADGRSSGELAVNLKISVQVSQTLSPVSGFCLLPISLYRHRLNKCFFQDLLPQCVQPLHPQSNRPFSPPVHSASPPPVAPLARAESTSSISSANSMSAATTPTNDQPSLVWFDRGKFYLTFEGCSRGPSPLTMGAQDTLPVAAAFTETVNAFFKGADPSKCVVKIIGEMVLSFPAGITRHFANNPSPAVLTFSITNYSRLEHVLPNPQLLCCDTTTKAKDDAKDFWVNMPNLITHLKKVAEQKPQATYYNVDMLKYQVSCDGPQSVPLNLAVSWRCEPTSTDLRIDYKYNGGAMATPMALNNVQFLVPVDGGVTKLQAILPPAAWNTEQKRILWKIPDISQKSENGGVGSLLARFQLTEGPSKPAPLAVQFTSEGSTLSGCDIELAGPGYRFSLIKKRFAAGKYLADN